MKTTLRGFMLAPYPSIEDVGQAIETGANLLRWPIYFDPSDVLLKTYEGYESAVMRRLDYLDGHVLPRLQGKAKVIIDLHSPVYGADSEGKHLAFSSPEKMKDLLKIWDMIARRYLNNETVLGYDTINEPNTTVKKLNQFLIEVHKTIRKVDKKKRIIVECLRGDATHFNKLPFIKDDRVWYSFHMYYPLALTHQGVYGNPTGRTYPTNRLNRNNLVKYLTPVRKFREKNPKARVYAGEFSISVYADTDTRKNYMLDCLSLFETGGYQWTYHAWKESPIWDCTEYLPILKAQFSKNR